MADDGRRENMRELADIKAALPRTEGDLVFMLDVDRVPIDPVALPVVPPRLVPQPAATIEPVPAAAA